MTDPGGSALGAAAALSARRHAHALLQAKLARTRRRWLIVPPPEGEPPMPLSPGDRAPDFDLPTEAGRVSLGALQGKTVVLYFYPKDDTSGCTAEAQGFSAAAADFAKAGAVVVGVSKDSAVSHGKFKGKYGLEVLLGSAKDDDVVERYGAWIEKSLYGRKYMGIDRSTFLIDKGGVIRKVWRKVKVPGHVAQVLTEAKSLAGA
jgi:peroxiredoxin Q/BCP